MATAPALAGHMAGRRGLPPRGIDVVALVDRSSEHSSAAGGFGEDFDDTRLYHVTPDGMERVGGGAEFPEITATSTFEANSGSAETLKKFVRFAKLVKNVAQINRCACCQCPCSCIPLSV